MKKWRERKKIVKNIVLFTPKIIIESLVTRSNKTMKEKKKKRHQIGETPFSLRNIFYC